MEEPEVKRGRPPRPQTLPVKLLKAYWPHDGRGKQPTGTEIDLPVDEARTVVKSGIAVRNDEF